MRVITTVIALAALLGAMSLNAFAESSGCKKGYKLDKQTGKCIKISKGSH